MYVCRYSVFSAVVLELLAQNCNVGGHLAKWTPGVRCTRCRAGVIENFNLHLFVVLLVYHNLSSLISCSRTITSHHALCFVVPLTMNMDEVDEDLQAPRFLDRTGMDPIGTSAHRHFIVEVQIIERLKQRNGRDK
jgi:hypothetical protein